MFRKNKQKSLQSQVHPSTEPAPAPSRITKAVVVSGLSEDVLIVQVTGGAPRPGITIPLQTLFDGSRGIDFANLDVGLWSLADDLLGSRCENIIAAAARSQGIPCIPSGS
jgi:hypothetical protein